MIQSRKVCLGSRLLTRHNLPCQVSEKPSLLVEKHSREYIAAGCGVRNDPDLYQLIVFLRRR